MTTTTTAPALVPRSTPLQSVRWTALGTECFIQSAGDNAPASRAFASAAQAWVAAFEAKYSRFRPDSLISRINGAAGRDWVEVDEEMERILDLSGSIYSLTKGLLDITALPDWQHYRYKVSDTVVPLRNMLWSS